MSYAGDVAIPKTVAYQDKIYRVTKIGDKAFYQCADLTSIDIPEGIEAIGSFAFQQCSSLKSVVVPGTVDQVSYRSFSNCNNLERVVLQKGFRSVYAEAFSYCGKLRSLELNDGLQELGYLCFLSSNLKSVTLPSTLTSINKAFNDAPIDEVYVESLVPPTTLDNYMGGTIYDKSSH